MATDTLSLLRAGRLAGATRLDLNEGLKEFPREIFDLADTLEVLNLSQNQLSALPADLSQLKKLRVLFCSENPFRHFPEVLGECPNLSMIGFKSCLIERVESAALPPTLRWLILTDNHIAELPTAIGGCQALQKLMLSGNHLQHLPEAMAACKNLELVRLAANRFRALPDWLLSLPRLAWLAIAGNPLSTVSMPGVDATTFDWSTLSTQAKIGEGASGIIHRALLRSEGDCVEVAVKVFKGTMTSDGLPASELAASLAAGRHENLVEVLGQISNHPEGAAGLVMPLIEPTFRALAGPPSLDSCTRDIYPDGQQLSLPVLLRIALGVALAAAHLHEQGITHSDLYAHNVLWNPQGECLLGDFGAASSYPTNDQSLSPALQQIEVRAFGCLLEELLLRCGPGDGHDQLTTTLWGLQKRCAAPVVSERPLFAEVVAELRRASPGTISQPPSAPS